MRIIATGLIAVIVLGLGASRAWREAGLFTVALALGAVLWLTSFSFAGAWRRVMRERRTAGTRAQVLLIGLSVALFLPAISAGTVLGGPVRGFIFSVGPALVVGAFLFGVGMQLGAGCGSGTLCTGRRRFRLGMDHAAGFRSRRHLRRVGCGMVERLAAMATRGADTRCCRFRL